MRQTERVRKEEGAKERKRDKEMGTESMKDKYKEKDVG